jgi:hypothetical protein
MIEQVFIRGVIMGENPAGQKLVQPMMDNADGLRIWTNSRCLIPSSDVVVLPKGRPGDYIEWDNGTGYRQLYRIHTISICSDCIRYQLSDFAPVVDHKGIKRIMSKEEAVKRWEELKNG